MLGRHGFGDAASRIANQALELLDAPNCPSGEMDLLLAPDQMVLQIHESIGHPLELDRILGDERNYAGTSFVTADMFGSFQYGSELLNVTFDPTVPGQLASYGFDDDGTPATRQHLIENGILKRGLGGAVSQQRTGLDGVANSRASGWNRPPIDRMANLNVEPGDSTVEELIAFDRARRVPADEPRRGRSTTAATSSSSAASTASGSRTARSSARSATPGTAGSRARSGATCAASANADSFTVMGTPNCGKGELNQMVGTGHASPACLFADVEVFGGEAVTPGRRAPGPTRRTSTSSSPRRRPGSSATRCCSPTSPASRPTSSD